MKAKTFKEKKKARPHIITFPGTARNYEILYGPIVRVATFHAMEIIKIQ